MSIADILNMKREDARVHGVMIGVVSSIEDPDKLGRVKVKFPRIDDTNESDWIRIATPMAGKERGIFFLPEVDDEVLVAFEYGRINMPYIIGALWNGVDLPPNDETDAYPNADNKNNIRLIRSRSGHVIKLNDEDGAETIEIYDKTAKNFIKIDTASNTIFLTSEANIEITAKEELKITAKTLVVETSDATTITATGDFSAETKAAMTLKSASGSTVESSASTTVKGSTVEVNGSGGVTVTGTPTNIN